jgi:hypothetical protein
MLGPNPTEEHFRLAAYYLTDLSFQASGAKPLVWGEFMEQYTTTYARGQPGLLDNPVMTYVNKLHVTGAVSRSTALRRTLTTRRHDPTRECNAAWCRPRAAPTRSRHRVTAPPPPNDGRGSMNSRRPSASSKKGWPCFTRRWGWTQSPVIDNRHRTSSCRSSPVRGTTNGGSAARLPNNPKPAQQRRRPRDEHATTTDAPTRAQTPTPTLTPRHSSSGHRKTSPQQLCCCAAARRW